MGFYDTIWGLLFWGVLASSSLHQEWSPVLNQRPGNLSWRTTRCPDSPDTSAGGRCAGKMVFPEHEGSP